MRIAPGKAFKILLIIVTVLVLGWWLSIFLFGWPYSYQARRLFGSDGLEIVREAAETQVYRVQTASIDIEKSNSRIETSGTINGYPILARPAVLSAQSTSELRTILLRRKLYDVAEKEIKEETPFLPNLAFRWHEDGENISLLVCVPCKMVESIKHDDKGRTLWQRRRLVTDLSQVESLARSSFPAAAPGTTR